MNEERREGIREVFLVLNLGDGVRRFRSRESGGSGKMVGYIINMNFRFL